MYHGLTLRYEIGGADTKGELLYTEHEVKIGVSNVGVSNAFPFFFSFLQYF